MLGKAAVPALLLIASLILPRYILPPEMAGMVEAEGAGPTFWPTTMLVLIGLCSLVWLVRVVWAARRQPAVAAAPAEPVGYYNAPLAWAGVALTFVYGYAIQVLGFAVATLLFLVAWFLLGGVRKPLTVAPVAVVGTLVLLWVFVALAQMPLDRGRGIFTAATDELYDVMGIY
jgi:putative tricarboxylic transport membrane protein